MGIIRLGTSCDQMKRPLLVMLTTTDEVRGGASCLCVDNEKHMTIAYIIAAVGVVLPDLML